MGLGAGNQRVSTSINDVQRFTIRVYARIYVQRLLLHLYKFSTLCRQFTSLLLQILFNFIEKAAWKLERMPPEIGVIFRKDEALCHEVFPEFLHPLVVLNRASSSTLLRLLFLTHRYKLPVERVWISVFEDDDESLAIWRDEVGVSPERIKRMGAADNFWSSGPTGPCGPCSEMYYDFHPERGHEGAVSVRGNNASVVMSLKRLSS